MASTLNLGAVKTPGVYIDEMSLFPPSVAQVDTAIPAFIGPTEQHSKDGQSLRGMPVKINSMVEYRRYFGGAPERNALVSLTEDGVESVHITPSTYMFDSVMLFFANGGEKCYIVSTGRPNDDQDYISALDELRKYDEPTLLVMPDAVTQGSEGAAVIQQAALDHCAAMQDRFAVLDVRMEDVTSSRLDETDILAFRNGVTGNLNYGAAYYPYVHTSLPLSARYQHISISQNNTTTPLVSLVTGEKATVLATSAQNLVTLVGTVKGFVPDPATINAQPTLPAKKDELTRAVEDAAAAISTAGLADALGTGVSSISLINTIDALLFATDVLPMTERVIGYIQGLLAKLDARLGAIETEMRSSIPLYATIVAAIESQGIIVPPSGAVTGVYARTDSDRGVWKSPANVGLNYVTGPVVRLTDRDQESLNVDPEAGKSINAVRAFTGKGTLVWGARTLAGSDNEWRYVAVRRFFLMVEESIKKATGQFVFEANDANTWVRVRAMIENFLTLQWRAGALAGTKAENAFFVRVGLGQTMTPEDVLNGFLIVEIGMAVVRPAEFIVLRFSHKMQEA